MCCEKCTNGGISTSYGKDLLDQVASDQRWLLRERCPKMVEDTIYGKDAIMWGICRAKSDLSSVECCRKCDYFS